MASTKSENKRKAEDKRFLRAYSYCGDPKEAARIVGVKMSQAYRALADPDGLAYLEDLCAKDSENFYKLDRAQRKAILTMCAVGGVMPRIVFDEEGPGEEIMLEGVSQQQRLRCLELLGKMEGDFVEQKVIKNLNGDQPGPVTPEMRAKLDEVYGDINRMNDEEDDPLAL